MAIVPDLYHGKVADGPEDAHELMRGLEDTRVFSELDAARAWLAAQPRTAKTRLGIMGFCRGGRTVWEYCAHNPDVKAGVAFYGLELAGAWPSGARRPPNPACRNRLVRQLR